MPALRVILTKANAAVIAARHPAYVVVDLESQRVWTSADLFAQFPPVMFRFAAGIIAASGQLVTYRDLIEGVWGDDPNGGPGDARTLLNVYLHQSRRRLAPIGLGIATRWGHGLKAERSKVEAVIERKSDNNRAFCHL